MVLGPHGMPMRQYLLPGREQGRMLKSTHPQLSPGTSELYLCSTDLFYGGAAIFTAPGLAPSHAGFAWTGR